MRMHSSLARRHFLFLRRIPFAAPADGPSLAGRYHHRGSVGHCLNMKFGGADRDFGDRSRRRPEAPESPHAHRTLWSMDNKVTLMDAAAPAPKPRGPYKKAGVSQGSG